MALTVSLLGKEIARQREFSQGLVASWYRRVPTDEMPKREAAESRKARAIRRLIVAMGREAVIARLRAAVVSRDDEIRRAWLVLEAQGAEVTGQRGGSF